MNNKQTSNLGNDFGRVPPSNVDLEETILGALILESSAIERIENILRPECFYNDSHAKIFECILNMYRNQKPIDIQTIGVELMKSGNIEAIGGPFYIAQLANKVASSAHIENHSLIVFESYLKRETIRIAAETQSFAYDNSNDIEDVLSKLNAETEKLNDISVGQTNDNKISSIAKKCISSLEKRNINYSEGIVNGIPTGINELDKKIIGWQNSDLIILAGRPAMGKSALMLHFAKSAAQSKTPCVIFSLEMADQQLVDRIIIGESEINPKNYKTGNVRDEDWVKIEKGLSEVEKLPIIIDQTPRITTNNIRSIARRLHKQGKCKMIFIDYLQLIGWSNPKDNATNQIAIITRELKLLAKELDIPIILLSQLNRDVEKKADKRPELSHLRDSGAIEQDADIVMFAYRPAYYKITVNGEDMTGRGKIIIAKFREGNTDDVVFYHNPSLTKITDYPQTNIPF